MIRSTLRTVAVCIAVTGLSSFAQVPLATPRIESLLAKLPGDRIDESDLWALESQPPDSKTIPALKAAFDIRTQKREKQWIAQTLLRLGEKTGDYFGFLASYASDAIEDRTPSFIKYDSNGHSIRGEFSAAFENWCAQNGKDPRAVAANQFSVYPEDVLMLSKVGDPRARDLLRRGLDSPHGLIVAFSVQGLGRLQDTGALPLIAKALERLPSDERYAVAMQLPWFGSHEADLLMERMMPDRKARDYYARGIEQQRIAELDRIRNRTSAATPK